MKSSSTVVGVGFLCTWCAYRAADLAGTTRRAYAPGFRPLRVICSGRVGPELVLRALAAGADGVLVVGCRPGECHRVDGNLKSLRRLTLLRRVLAQVGIEQERVGMVFTAASEGGALAEAADGLMATLRELGPLTRRTPILGVRRSENKAGPWGGG